MKKMILLFTLSSQLDSLPEHESGRDGSLHWLKLNVGAGVITKHARDNKCAMHIMRPNFWMQNTILYIVDIFLLTRWGEQE